MVGGGSRRRLLVGVAGCGCELLLPEAAMRSIQCFVGAQRRRK